MNNEENAVINKELWNSVFSTNADNETPLYYAARLKRWKIFSLLLSEFTISRLTLENDKLLKYLFQLERWESLHEFLLQTNKTFWEQFVSDHHLLFAQTLFKRLILEGKTECVKTLLRKGISPNFRDVHGNTLLHDSVTAASRSKKIIKQLLLFGADPYIKNEHGQTALDIASPKIKDYILKGRECIQLIKNFGHLQDPKIIALYFNLTPEGRLFFMKYAITQPNQSGIQNKEDSAFHKFPQEIRDRIGHYVSPTLSEIVRKHGLFQHYTQTTTNPNDTTSQHVTHQIGQ